MNGGKEIRGARGWLLVTFEFNFFETNNKIRKISNNSYISQTPPLKMGEGCTFGVSKVGGGFENLEIKGAPFHFSGHAT